MSASRIKYLRLRHKGFGLLLICAGCNSLFNINKPVRDSDVPDGTIACESTSDCLSEGPICLFSRCCASCETDLDCTDGRRCLHTASGAACVSNAQATCEMQESCPEGTVCVDKGCFSACAEDSPCLDGHGCVEGACVGPAVTAAGTGGTAGVSGVGGRGPGASGTGPGVGGTGPGAGGTGPEAGGAPTCGNGMLQGNERCDDANTLANDGCSPSCGVEQHWSCDDTEPSTCSPKCGDGFVVGPEAKLQGCDDANVHPNDGCSANCRVEPGFVCTGAPSVCIQPCGDGKLEAGEECDDENSAAGDGCDACAIEQGYACDNSSPPSKCVDIDECSKATHPCNAHADCTNEVGTFRCACHTGYVGDGVKCTRTSCQGMSGTECQGGDCCESPTVAGGYFALGGVSGATQATVSAFALDKYEVTVGRFRNFVAAYQGYPAEGAGAHPLIGGSGWQPQWNSYMAVDKASLAAAVQCDPTYHTWDPSGARDTLPMNCVNWFEAFAFCAWDGGRLPTETEWEYAAAGGIEQRIYPWGNTPVPDDTQDQTAAYANYYGLGDGSAAAVYSFADILPVGSRPAGRGRYGQMDLAGSVWDWTLDWVAPYPTPQCNNCANLKPAAARSLRGGAFYYDAANLLVTARSGNTPEVHYSPIGFRCARVP